MLTQIGVKHLVRRGWATAHKKQIEMKDIPVVPLMVMITIVLVGLFSLVYLSLGSNIIMTLTAVEAEPSGYERVPREEGDESKESLLSGKEGKDEEDVPPPYEELPTTRITSSLRATFRHLRNEDGLLRFPVRGIRTFAWYNIMCMLVGNFVGLPLASMMKFDISNLENYNMYQVTETTGLLLGKGLARMFLANMFVVVTHAQIASTATNNSYGTSFKRVLKAPWKNALPTVLPLLIVTFTTCYIEFLAEGYLKATVLALQSSAAPPVVSSCALASAAILMFLSGLSGMAMLRIHASSFPRQDKTVVPVNFGFGMIPESDEVKVLSFCQALRSYTKQDIINIVLMFVKLTAINYLAQSIIIFVCYVGFMYFFFSAFNI